jgi:hypothetical protein
MTDFHFPDDEPTAPNVIPLPVTPKPEAPRRESRFAAVYQALEERARRDGARRRLVNAQRTAVSPR